MLGAMMRDPRAGKATTRRSASSRGAVRVSQPAPRTWPSLFLRWLSLQGTFGRAQQILWPVLLLALGVGLYELGSRLWPLADRPIPLRCRR